MYLKLRFVLGLLIFVAVAVGDAEAEIGDKVARQVETTTITAAGSVTVTETATTTTTTTTTCQRSTTFTAKTNTHQFEHLATNRPVPTPFAHLTWPHFTVSPSSLLPLILPASGTHWLSAPAIGAHISSSTSSFSLLSFSFACGVIYPPNVPIPDACKLLVVAQSYSKMGGLDTFGPFAFEFAYVQGQRGNMSRVVLPRNDAQNFWVVLVQGNGGDTLYLDDVVVVTQNTSCWS